jgi:hypothetical protein
METRNSSARKDRGKSNRLSWLFSILLEHLLLGLSIGFIIPPVPSNEERYYFQSALIPMLICLVLSRLLAMRRGQETWLGFLLKAFIFTLACWLNHERVLNF